MAICTVDKEVIVKSVNLELTAEEARFLSAILWSGVASNDQSTPIYQALRNAGFTTVLTNKESICVPKPSPYPALRAEGRKFEVADDPNI